MRARLGVALGVLLTALFVWGLGWIAYGFIRAGGVVGWGFAAAIAILVVLTVWVTWREVLFGMHAARLSLAYETDAAGMIDDAGAATALDDPRAEFEAARSAVEEGERDDWRAWYRLAVAYDAMRDRKQARACLRRAITADRGAAVPRR